MNTSLGLGCYMTSFLVAGPIPIPDWLGMTSYFRCAGQRDGNGGNLGGYTLNRDTGIQRTTGRVQFRKMTQQRRHNLGRSRDNPSTGLHSKTEEKGSTAGAPARRPLPADRNHARHHANNYSHTSFLYVVLVAFRSYVASFISLGLKTLKKITKTFVTSFDSVQL